MIGVLVEFTKMRKGSRPRSLRRIVVCQKCSRKGEVSRLTNKRTGDTYEMVTHIGHVVTVAGIAFLSIDEQCNYAIDANGAAI